MTTDTDRFRDALLNRQELLESTIAHHDIGGASQTEETGELGSPGAVNHLADTASETFERELDEGLEADAARQLREVEAALERIALGSFGTCSVCGKPIGDKRLEAVPWTTLCIDDAKAQEGR